MSNPQEKTFIFRSASLLYPIRSMSVYLFKGIEVILLLLCRFVAFIEINVICEPLAIEDMESGMGGKIIFIGATDRNS